MGYPVQPKEKVYNWNFAVNWAKVTKEKFLCLRNRYTISQSYQEISLQNTGVKQMRSTLCRSNTFRHNNLTLGRRKAFIS